MVVVALAVALVAALPVPAVAVAVENLQIASVAAMFVFRYLGLLGYGK